MKAILFTLTFLTVSLCLRAQDTDYYKDISLRKKKIEVENLPNLNSKYSKLYVGLAGALRFTPHFETQNFSDIGQNISNLNNYLELNLGLNLNNKWFFESGALRIKNQLASHILNSPYIYPFSTQTNSNQFYIPINVKREILSFNKITRNASLNLTAGASFQIYDDYDSNESQNLILDPRAHSYLIKQIRINTKHSKNPFLFHTGIEIRGNVTDRIELLAFGKCIFRENRYISNSFTIEYPNGTNSIYEIYEKPISIAVGLQFRFNSKKFYHYYSSL